MSSRVDNWQIDGFVGMKSCAIFLLMNFIYWEILICHYEEINWVIDWHVLQWSQERFITAKFDLIFLFFESSLKAFA
jgi:hypothetical protein